MAEQKYRVIGERAVAGVQPGGTLAPPAGVNVRALVKAGHLEPVPESKPEPKPDSRPVKKTETKP